MYLKKVELFGFKSFPDLTDFTFEKGITGILGPNGCGKSNVVDAIKWVLGERSAKNLRGKEMQDVIFSGCESRSASGMAKVNLVFDNSDFKLPSEYREICITRKLTRAGENTYMINGVQVPLREIRNLFLDTGVGNSAYSIIEQGRVEALLHAKPAERRAIFEEAAGIAKFKVRRKEIISRLDRTGQVLLRVNDRLEEREKQIRRVGDQAAKARRWRKLKNELDSAMGFLYRRRFADCRRSLENLARDRAALEAQMAEEDARMSGIALAMARLSDEEAKLSAERDGAAQSASESQDEATRAALELAEAKNRLESLRRDLERGRKQETELRERLGRLTEQAATAAADIEAAAYELADLDGRFASQDEERRRLLALAEAAEAEVTRLRVAMIDLNRRDHELSSSIARLEATGQSVVGQLSGFDARLADMAGREAEASTAVLSLEAEYREAETKFQTVADELAGAREGLAGLKARAEAIFRDERTLESDRSAKSARKSTLEDLERSFDGAFEGVRNTLTAARDNQSWSRGVIGMASDLMTVPRDLALAVETILGGSAQDIVVERASDAQELIGHLKRNRLGRATFLPLDRIQPRRRLNSDLRHIPGVLGEAVDLVSFAPGHRTAMEYLLAGVLVVDNLGLARELSGREARGVKIVTLEGDVVSPSGAMTGGHGRQQRAGLVQRKAELDALADELARVESLLAAKSAEREAILSQAAGMGERIQSLEAGLAGMGRAEADLKGRLAAARSEVERLARERLGVLGEKERLAASAGGWEAELAAAGTELAGVKAAIAEMGRDIETKTEDQRRTRSALDGLGGDYAALSAERATAKAKVASLEAHRRDLEAEIEVCRKELEGDGSSFGDVEAEMEALRGGIAELEQAEAGALRRRDESRSLAASLASRLTAAKEDMEAKRSEENEVRTQQGRLSSGMAEVDKRVYERGLYMDNLREKAKNDLGVEDLDAFFGAAVETAATETEGREDATLFEAPPASGMDSVWSGFDDAALQAEVDSRAGKLRALGSVNHAAIDELAELEAGAKFLRCQKDDLDEAAGDMRAAIDKLNQESSTRFQETFVVVRRNFREMFAKMFGGGNADLILEEVTDPAMDPLDAGIEIKAQPPGKEAKSISLLSGGEKALCAVALLFALFRSKPSPFCILDEVDGPLDESNIVRFMDQVKEFSSDTQFIIITHSKATMQRSEAIWGVTQDEKGVSVKRSLKFSAMAEIAEPGISERREAMPARLAAGASA